MNTMTLKKMIPALVVCASSLVPMTSRADELGVELAVLPSESTTDRGGATTGGGTDGSYEGNTGGSGGTGGTGGTGGGTSGSGQATFNCRVSDVASNGSIPGGGVGHASVTLRTNTDADSIYVGLSNGDIVIHPGKEATVTCSETATGCQPSEPVLTADSGEPYTFPVFSSFKGEWRDVSGTVRYNDPPFTTGPQAFGLTSQCGLTATCTLGGRSRDQI